MSRNNTRPQLPPSLRSSLVERVDRRLAAIVGASLLAHLGIAAWAWTIERESAVLPGEQVALYEPPTYDVIELSAHDLPATLPATPPGPAPVEPGIAAPVAPQQQTPTAMPRPDVHRLPEPVDVDRWANALTTSTTRRDGRSELPSRGPHDDLERQVKQITDGNLDVKVGRTTPRDRDPRLGTGPGRPGIGDPRLSQVAKREKPPITRIELVPMPRPPGPEDPLPINLVLGRIQSMYMAGLQRCYIKHGLAQDASMVARVALSFTVDEQGRATDNQAHGASAEVDGCIRDQMAGWRFRIPKDLDGDPTDAAFKLVLALQPS